MRAAEDVDAHQGKEATTLMIAAACGIMDMLRILIEAGANMTISPSERVILLKMAVFGGHVEVL